MKRITTRTSDLTDEEVIFRRDGVDIYWREDGGQQRIVQAARRDVPKALREAVQSLVDSEQAKYYGAKNVAIITEPDPEPDPEPERGELP